MTSSGKFHNSETLEELYKNYIVPNILNIFENDVNIEHSLDDHEDGKSRVYPAFSKEKLIFYYYNLVIHIRVKDVT